MAGQAPELVGRILQDTYKVERLIGEGGMGCVFEASHLRLRRRFAIKLLATSVARDPEALARFRREAEVTSELGHPNIVEVIDFNTTEEGTPYLVMELLQGEALDRRLAKAPRLPLPQVRSILEQAASALQAAHQHNVVHRDLKPPNIFLQPDLRGEQVKLLDFGISKVLGSTSLVTGAFTLIGTPNYMSPEQAEGRNAEVDARTDIFAMGTILYEMLGGRQAFLGDTVPSILFQVVHKTPQPLAGLRPDLPRGVCDAVMRAINKRPEARQGSIVELAQEFVAGISTSGAEVSRSTTAAVAATLAQPAPPAEVARQQPSHVTTISSGVGELERPRHSPTERVPVDRRLIIAVAVVVIALGGLGLYLGASRRRDDGEPLSIGAAARAPSTVARRDGSVVQDRSRPAVADSATRLDQQSIVGTGKLTLSGGFVAEELPHRLHVKLDGKRIEDTPFHHRRVKAGSHWLEISWPGYQTERRQITVEPGGEVTLGVKLRKLH